MSRIQILLTKEQEKVLLDEAMDDLGSEILKMRARSNAKYRRQLLVRAANRRMPS